MRWGPNLHAAERAGRRVTTLAVLHPRKRFPTRRGNDPGLDSTPGRGRLCENRLPAASLGASRNLTSCPRPCPRVRPVIGPGHDEPPGRLAGFALASHATVEAQAVNLRVPRDH